MAKRSQVLVLSALIAIAGATFARADDSPDPQVAASMSLTDAKALIQRWNRFQWSDLTMQATTSMEFGSAHITLIRFESGVAPRQILVCPYEAFDPLVVSETAVIPDGAHKGENAFLINSGSGEGDGCEFLVDVALTHDIAMRTAAAMLRWKNSTLAERQALPALQQQQFAAVVSAYLAKSPRPEISEDVRRLRVIAETALQEKRISDAVNAYEDCLALAPWWPEGHFNAALALGELHYYDDAIDHMKKFIALVPNAPDARAAQDKIYSWQGEQQALPQ